MGILEKIRDAFVAKKDDELPDDISNKRIAIARDFALILNDNGYQTLLGRNEQFRQLQSDTSDPIISIAASFAGYMGLTRSGRIVTGGRANEFDCYDEIESWRDVIDISSSEGHTVALLRDGTVRCADEPGGYEDTPERFKKVVETWKNMKQVAVGYDNIIGLTNEGKLLYNTRDGGDNGNSFRQLSNAVQVDAFSWYYGVCNAAVLLSNGTIITNYGETYKWGDVVHISIDGNGDIVGLLRNGCVVGAGDEDMVKTVSTWTNIVSIECKNFKVVALKTTGEILIWNRNI
jgi:hypothetical protein